MIQSQVIKYERKAILLFFCLPDRKFFSYIIGVFLAVTEVDCPVAGHCSRIFYWVKYVISKDLGSFWV